jgi:hypothetical protein
MPDRDAVDCPPGNASSMYAQRVPAIVDRALAHAGVTEEVRAQVQASLGELKYVDGQVVAVSTTKAERLIFVSGPRDGSALAKFGFPPNKDGFQSELMRAQDTGRIVSASGNNVIQDVWIYAGSATSSPRY